MYIDISIHHVVSQSLFVSMSSNVWSWDDYDDVQSSLDYGMSNVCPTSWDDYEMILHPSWLVVWNIFVMFPYIGNSNPNWLIFFRGVAQPPTRWLWYYFCSSFLRCTVCTKYIWFRHPSSVDQVLEARSHPGLCDLGLDKSCYDVEKHGLWQVMN